MHLLKPFWFWHSDLLEPAYSVKFFEKHLSFYTHLKPPLIQSSQISLTQPPLIKLLYNWSHLPPVVQNKHRPLQSPHAGIQTADDRTIQRRLIAGVVQEYRKERAATLGWSFLLSFFLMALIICWQYLVKQRICYIGQTKVLGCHQSKNVQIQCRNSLQS